MDASQAVGVSLNFAPSENEKPCHPLSNRLSALLSSVLPVDDASNSVLAMFRWIPLDQARDEPYKRFHRLIKTVFFKTHDQILSKEINAQALRFSESANTALSVKLYKCLAAGSHETGKGVYYYACRNGDLAAVEHLLQKQGLEGASLPSALNPTCAPTSRLNMPALAN